MVGACVVSWFFSENNIGTIAGKEGRGKLKEVLPSWLLETSEGDIDYPPLMELAQKRARWSQ